MMDIIIRISPELNRFVESLNNVAKRQVPYASSRAINEVLIFAQNQVRRELPQHFKIRSTWVSRGIRINLSNKNTLTGLIFSKDGFMAQQELGGEKRPGEGPMAIPFAIRGKDGMGKTLKNRWPGELMGKDGVFKIRTKYGVDLLMQRKGRRKKEVVVLYAMKDKPIQIKGRWNFRHRVRQIAEQLFPLVFKAELAAAIRGRR